MVDLRMVIKPMLKNQVKFLYDNHITRRCCMLYRISIVIPDYVGGGGGGGV